ncbi:hypothetical protein B0A53_06110 [Rhodotorula sp. CCFEE 5036]|nr:hypothetical protein B0A53_06110 [Rhodotorula sp. CCFEE 5036]
MAKDTQYSLEQVQQHNKEGDLWLVVNGNVYDLSKFAELHPGGAGVLLAREIAGQDASEPFFSLHRSDVLTKYDRLRIGRLAPVKASESAPKRKEYLLPVDGELSPVPHAEPDWLHPKLFSPYYSPSHRALQTSMRDFFDSRVRAEAQEFELSGERPTRKLVELMGTPEWDIHAMRMGPGRHLHGKTLPGGVRGENFDYFHELVVVQEMCRVGAPGLQAYSSFLPVTPSSPPGLSTTGTQYMAGLQAGMVIGLPPVLNFAGEEMRNRILPDILAGKKFISLAISEPHAGSDVQGIHTTATLLDDGKYYTVKGQKKWITNGHFSDYFMTAVRTGPNSLSMMLIERDDNVETRKIKTSYSASAGTAYVFFEGVKVPVENVLGGVGNGLKVILSNFNHERWVICVRIARYNRLIYEETFKWAHLRMSAGKRLIDNAVVRAKFAKMIAKIDAGQTWLEHITYQMTKLSYAEQSQALAGPMALLKYYLARCGREISDDAVQIWGGRGITQGGMGRLIEQHQRTFHFDTLLGGADEVLADLGVRQASKPADFNLAKMSERAVVVPDRMLNGDCSNFTIVVINQHVLNIWHEHGLVHWQTAGSLHKTIAISDIAIIEGWPLGEVMQLFPDSPDIHRDWSGKIQLFSLFDLSAEGFKRILKTLIVENPDATEDVDLSNLHGFQNLSKDLQEFVAAYAKEVLNNETSTDGSVRVAPGTLMSTIALLARLRHGPSLPDPRRLPRRLTELALRARFEDSVHTTAADFPHGWELPTATALEAAVEKAQLYGYAFADPAEAATLPAHVAEIVEGAPTPRLS